MKLTHKITAVIAVLALVLPVLLTGCNDDSADTLYYEYNYDLSEYITLGEYKGISLVESEIEVTEEELEMQIQSMLTSQGQSQNIHDKPLEIGDTVIFRSNVTLDGEVIEELCEESGTFMVGYGNYGEEIDEALIGAVQGDTVYAKRTLDELYGEYAGKTVDYEIYVLGGYTILLPNYTDAFVKAYYGYDTIEQFEASVYDQMYEFRQENHMRNLVNQAWTTVLENTTVIAYPEQEVDEIVAYNVENAKMNAAAANMEYENYVSAVFGQTVEEYESSFEEEAKATVKEDMVIYAIARAENLSVSKEKYEEYLARFIEQYDDFMYTHEVENTFGKDLLMSRVLREVVKEYIVEVAEITDANTIAE